MTNILEQITQIDGYFWPKNSENTFKLTMQTLGMSSTILPHLKNKNVMIQAGGNCGLTITPFVEEFKNIYTFEPDPINFLCLNNNLPFTNVNKIQACLGEEHRLVNIDLGWGTDRGSFFVSGKGKIPMFKIDDLKLDECDLIMLDTEGYEYYSLLGGIETIKKYKPVICFEYYDEWLARFGSSLQQIENLLINELGYKRTDTYRTSYSVDLIYTF